MSKKPNKPINKWIQLINIPIQMGVVIFLISYFGKYLDIKYNNLENTNTIIFTLIGVAVSMYLIIVQVKKLDK